MFVIRYPVLSQMASCFKIDNTFKPFDYAVKRSTRSAIDVVYYLGSKLSFLIRERYNINENKKRMKL